MNEINYDSFMTITIGIIVLFIGSTLNKRIYILRHYNIPEPVTGGLLAAIFTYAVYIITNNQIVFDLSSRDQLLIYFFTGIGLNARLSDLAEGGRPLVILLVLTLSYIVLQDVVGIGGAMLAGIPSQVGVLAGSASLIGGHGTAIAWAPAIADLGVENALEIGVASATLGLIVASMVGGPIAQYLIQKKKLSGESSEQSIVGIAYEKQDTETLNHLSIMVVILTLHVTIIIGYFVSLAIAALGLNLPLFVSCLLTAILLSYIVPRYFPNLHWPARTRSLALVSDFSLGLFLVMSLMSMQIWSIADLAGPLLFILLMQTAAAVFFIFFILFPLMGSNYQAAVLSAGFGGFALGATPTAIANMSAVTKTHGPAPTAFIILPLVAAFFVDITNAFVIQFAITL
jgi:ESS family glutamate:Na+ symporter